MNDIVPQGQLTANDMKAHVQRIQHVMRAVMKDGTHYGKIPGTPKPSLWKPGAEVLCATFRISPTYRVEDLSDSDCVRYRVCCIGTHQTTGVVLGEGLGEASTNEEKYKWRAAKGHEFADTAEDRRRVKYAQGQNGAYEIEQVRTEPADQANTVLKMACKRAQVAMTLNVTAASDIFSQDLEDLEGDELRRQQAAGNEEGRTGKPRTDAPRASGGGGGKATDRQIKLIHARLDESKVDKRDFCAEFKIESVTDLPFAQVNAALDWISQKGQGTKHAAAASA